MSFDAVAEHYERGRPGYPDDLIEDVLALAGLNQPRILEIGAGAGLGDEAVRQ